MILDEREQRKPTLKEKELLLWAFSCIKTDTF